VEGGEILLQKKTKYVFTIKNSFCGAVVGTYKESKNEIYLLCVECNIV